MFTYHDVTSANIECSHNNFELYKLKYTKIVFPPPSPPSPPPPPLLPHHPTLHYTIKWSNILFLHIFGFHCCHELTKGLWGCVDSLNIVLECAAYLEFSKVVWQQTTKPALNFTTGCVMTLPPWNTFEYPALTASYVIQVSFVKALCLPIMITHTASIAIFPGKATTTILCQKLTPLSLENWYSTAINLFTCKTNQCQLPEYTFSCLLVFPLKFNSTCSLCLDICCGYRPTEETGPTILSFLAKEIGQHLQGTVFLAFGGLH